jgi:hypothetical protein
MKRLRYPFNFCSTEYKFIALMKKKLHFLAVALILSLKVYLLHGQDTSKMPVYQIFVRINPDISRLEGRCKILNADTSVFLLNKCFIVSSITSNGTKVAFHKKQSQVNLNSFEIEPDDSIRGELTIEYSGQLKSDSIPRSISVINMIQSGLVELSDHIDWYPRLRSGSSIIKKFEADLPENYYTVTNLNLLDRRAKEGRNLTTWNSLKQVYGITLLSAENLKMSRIEGKGLTVEMYYDRLPDTYIDSMKHNLLKSFEILRAAYGAPGSDSLVKVVYSPRSAGGYARSPLIIVSENYALEQRSREFGQARDFRLNTHEIAHYWSLANSDTPDDWINEGLAEYSALLVSEEVIGKKFADLMIDEYKEIVNNTQTTCSITETTGMSRDREVNRYYKPALLLYNLQKEFGVEKMKFFLKDLYRNFTDLKEANTSVFLNVLGENYGKETMDRFSEALHLANWNQQANNSETSYILRDSSFIGTWTGPLTQFGATTKFVLNLICTDSKFTPSLDSPDQNVTGIPISDFKISDDSLSFKIGVASAVYRGRLDRKDMMITGVFYQRGGTYSLNLSNDKRVSDASSALAIQTRLILIDIAHKQIFWNDPERMKGAEKSRVDRVTYMTSEIKKSAASVHAGIGYLTEEINHENLKKCDLLFIHIPSARYKPAEIKAIVDYLKNGGSLFLAMDVDYWSTIRQTSVNEIIEPFGIKFGQQSPDTVSGGHTKAGIITDKPLKITFSDGRIITGGTPFCFSDQSEEYPFGVYRELEGGGKIIVMGDGMVSLYMTGWKGVNDYQCSDFMNDVFKWLLN